MKKTLRSLLLLIIGFLFIGCSHGLRITNLNEYYTPAPTPPKKTLIIGITSPAKDHVQNSKYVSAIVQSLQNTGTFERVIYPYNKKFHEGKVDVTVNINVNPNYSGRGSNFLVNWPGFIIFAPAIWGYGYNAEIETSVDILYLSDGNTQKMTIPTKYKFRQAEIDRTWTEVGWFEFGIIPLIGGIVFVQYDSDVTNEFIAKASLNYGTFVAQRIVEAMANYE